MLLETSAGATAELLQHGHFVGKVLEKNRAGTVEEEGQVPGRLSLLHAAGEKAVLQQTLGALASVFFNRYEIVQPAQRSQPGVLAEQHVLQAHRQGLEAPSSVYGDF